MSAPFRVAALLCSVEAKGVSRSGVGQSPEWIAMVACCRFSECREDRLLVSVRNCYSSFSGAGGYMS